jgi:hypothetical protein
MVPSRHIVFLLALLIAATVFLVRQQKFMRTRHTVADTQERVARLQERVASAELAANAERQQSAEQKASKSRLLAEIAAAEQELAKIDPDSMWATPPENGHEWNEKSPYVWLRKSMLSRLPVQPFNDQAELRGEVAAVLALDGTTQQTLNASLRQLAEEYHALETTHAERIDEPLPGITDDGPQVTVRVNPLPDDGSRFKKEFEDALTEALGGQRAGLLLQAAEGWLDSQFSQGGSEPKIISVVRHADGTYNVSVKSGYSWFSTAGFRELDQYVPKHLLPLFSDVIEPARSEPAQGPE